MRAQERAELSTRHDAHRVGASAASLSSPSGLSARKSAAAPASGRLCVLGTSFRRVGFRRLADLVLAPDDTDGVRSLARIAGADEAVYLATCNRVELYLLLPDETTPVPHAAIARALGLPADAPADALFVYRGDEAVRHLFRVASSLDSLVLGECEILGQVRRATERAEKLGLLGPGLDGLFRSAQRVANLVRRETAVGRTPVSVASLASRAIRDHFGSEPIKRAVLVGVGDMTRKVANTLKGRTELWIVNRTLARAEALAKRVGGRAMSLEAFKAAPPEWIDVLVTATGAPEPVIRAPELEAALAARLREGAKRSLLVCDLGLPPDVDPGLRDRAGVRLVGLGDLERIARKNQADLACEAEQAEAVVERECERFLARSLFSREAGRSMGTFLDARMAHLDEADRKELERFALRLANRLAALAAARRS